MLKIIDVNGYLVWHTNCLLHTLNVIRCDNNKIKDLPLLTSSPQLLSGRFVLQVLSVLPPLRTDWYAHNEGGSSVAQQLRMWMEESPASTSDSILSFSYFFCVCLFQWWSEAQGFPGSGSAPEPRAAHPGRAHGRSGPCAQGQVCTETHTHATSTLVSASPRP